MLQLRRSAAADVNVKAIGAAAQQCDGGLRVMVGHGHWGVHMGCNCNIGYCCGWEYLWSLGTLARHSVRYGSAAQLLALYDRAVWEYVFFICITEEGLGPYFGKFLPGDFMRPLWLRACRLAGHAPN